jgi:hypothetical protein
MPRGSKDAYTDKQKRKAAHIEAGYEERGVSENEAERRAWATVNKQDGGGKAAAANGSTGRAKKTARKHASGSRSRSSKSASKRASASRGRTTSSRTASDTARRKSTGRKSTGRTTASRTRGSSVKSRAR